MKMKLFSVAFVVLCCAGMQAVSSKFIIGGSPANHGEYPFMALLLRKGSFTCGGSLINSLHVLTAKHCVASGKASDYVVRLGEHRRDKNDNTEKNVAVKSIKKHPTEDIAILVLNEAVKESKYIKFLSLAQKEPAVGHPLTAIGWGWTKHSTSSSSNTLNELMLPLQSDQSCINDGIGWIRKNTQLCAGYTSGTYVNVCHGDSGSPLLVREKPGAKWQQVGVVHGGHGGCSSKYHMAVFVSVPSTRKWIVDNSKACFHGGVKVDTPAGQKTMADLQPGDMVLSATPTGHLKYSEVIMMMDSQPDLETDFIEVQTEHNTHPLTLTPQHLIFRPSANTSRDFASSDTVMARRLRVGDRVFRTTPDGETTAVTVTGVRTITLRGVYAPLTADGTVVAEGVVASSYAYLENQSVAHAAFAPVRWLKAGVELVWGKGQQDSGAGDQWLPGATNSVLGATSLFSS